MFKDEAMQPNNLPVQQSKPASALVVGGGIGGMRAALDLADAGIQVYLIEQTPCLGGRVAQLGYMFPQHDCVLCRGTPDHGYGCTRPSISPAYIHTNQHPNIEFFTNTTLVDVQGQATDFTVALRQEPRFVDPARCINCGYCAEACPVSLPDAYQHGMTQRKAVYKVAPRATPDTYVIDQGLYCADCGKCVEVCPSGAIDLAQQPRLLSLAVGAIILAVGFQIYDPAANQELGYGRFPNVISAMQYERLVSRSGPTEGIVNRPSDHLPPRKIAWLQCIGSRSQENSFCSSICCMYATKEAILAKQRLGAQEVDCTIFIIDERAFNKEYSRYFKNAHEKYNINYHRCRISAVHENPENHNLIIQHASPGGDVTQEEYDLVVLATGLQPPASAQQLAGALEIDLNAYGFCSTDKFSPLQTSRPGVYVCGAFSSPKEIAETILDASGAAAEVMRLLNDRLNTHPFTREWPFLTNVELPPEKDLSGQAPRVGVFACSCGDTINETLNLSEVISSAADWPGVAHARQLDFACFPEGLAQIKNGIQAADLNRVVIAGCSNRTHESLFQKCIREMGINPYLMEMVNLREQCANVHMRQKELANQKAHEILRVAVGRASLAEAVHKKRHRRRPSALVIGGGAAGMTAALTIADSGYPVHLVERSAMLGGNLADLYYVAEGHNPQQLLRDLVNRVRSHQQIRTYTRAEVIDHRGHVGDFQAVLRVGRGSGEADEVLIEHGVTVVATGGQELKQHPLLEIPGIITQRELETKIIHHPEEIAALKDVVMIQCVGPHGVAEYCSRVCCTNTLKNATRIKLFNPDCRVVVLYKDIVTYGFREQYYTEARKLGVIFFKFSGDRLPPVARDASSRRLAVSVYDPALGKQLTLPADLISLSMSAVPSSGTPELAGMLRVPLSSEGFFQEAQLKLRPMDFMRQGIFLAGMAAYPKFIEETISHSLAAAARALPLLSQEAMHLGGVIAVVDPDKCVGCLTCTRVCPFGIPQVVTANGTSGVGGLGGAAFIDDAQCQGCGTCTAECPANAIQLVNYRDEQMMLTQIQGLGAWSALQAAG